MIIFRTPVQGQDKKWFILGHRLSYNVKYPVPFNYYDVWSAFINWYNKPNLFDLSISAKLKYHELIYWHNKYRQKTLAIDSNLKDLSPYHRIDDTIERCATINAYLNSYYSFLETFGNCYHIIKSDIPRKIRKQLEKGVYHLEYMENYFLNMMTIRADLTHYVQPMLDIDKKILIYNKAKLNTDTKNKKVEIDLMFILNSIKVLIAFVDRISYGELMHMDNDYTIPVGTHNNVIDEIEINSVSLMHFKEQLKYNPKEHYKFMPFKQIPIRYYVENDDNGDEVK